MIKKEFVEKQVVQKVCVKETCYCDVCKKEINSDYWELITGHYDWDRDSVDSIEDYDVCSIECLDKLFGEYKESSSKEYNTKYFDVNHVNARKNNENNIKKN